MFKLVFLIDMNNSVYDFESFSKMSWDTNVHYLFRKLRKTICNIKIAYYTPTSVSRLILL